MNGTLHILIVEDNPADVDLIRDLLPAAGPVSCHVESVPRLSAALARLESTCADLVLLDLGLPDSQGLATFQALHQKARKIPVIVLTGSDDQELSVAAVRAGAQDYLVKGHLNNITLVRAVRYAMERKRAEEETEKLRASLAQSRKMETVGLLAGGVAHNFNNIFMGILGYADLCRDQLPPEHPIRPFLDEITSDIDRCAEVVRHLLAFSSKQTVVPKVMYINDAISVRREQLRCLIGENIDVAWNPGEALWPVKLDSTQLYQILTDLCTNARDAITGEGKIVVETANVTIRQAFHTRYMDAVPGDYVLLAVQDDGCGMDNQALDQLFEPFFTTKAIHTGAGMGLAAVYGIVKQNNGFIDVVSEPGKGSTFKIYVPSVVAAAKLASSGATAECHGGQKTVMVVDDEKPIRFTLHRFLAKLGYTVLVADSPAEALRLAGSHAGTIDLLITDVIMPDMNGRQMSEQICAARPDIKCLFMSGYADDILISQGNLTEDMHFLLKPFSREVFIRKVQEMLEGK